MTSARSRTVRAVRPLGVWLAAARLGRWSGHRRSRLLREVVQRRHSIVIGPPGALVMAEVRLEQQIQFVLWQSPTPEGRPATRQAWPGAAPETSMRPPGRPRSAAAQDAATPPPTARSGAGGRVPAPRPRRRPPSLLLLRDLRGFRPDQKARRGASNQRYYCAPRTPGAQTRPPPGVRQRDGPQLIAHRSGAR